MKNLISISSLLVLLVAHFAEVAMAASPLFYLNKGYCISSPKSYDDVVFRSSGRSCTAQITMQRQLTLEESQNLAEFEETTESSWKGSSISNRDAESIEMITAPTVALPFLTTTAKLLTDAVAGLSACDQARIAIQQLYDTGRICK